MPIFNQPDKFIHLRARKFTAAAAIGMLLCNHISFYSGHFLNKEDQVASSQPQERSVVEGHILLDVRVFWNGDITILHITLHEEGSITKPVK